MKIKISEDKEIEIQSISKNDIILLKGEWDHYSLQSIAKSFEHKKIECMLVVLPHKESLEVLPISDFHKILKETEKKMKITGTLLPVTLPEYEKPVRAIIKSFENFGTVVVDLIAVNEDDCNWRFVDDNCELENEWDVIYWEYI